MINILSFWSLPGIWIATAGAAFMLLNAVRSLTAPVPFARYLGLPLANDADAGMVKIYGLRALFIALALTGLLLQRDVPAIGAVTLAAVVMPVGDALFTARAGASRATVSRHVIIAVVLLVAAALLL